MLLLASTFSILFGSKAKLCEPLGRWDGPVEPAIAGGLSIRGPWIPGFEQLVHFVQREIPQEEGLLIIPGEGALDNYDVYRRKSSSADEKECDSVSRGDHPLRFQEHGEANADLKSDAAGNQGVARSLVDGLVNSSNSLRRHPLDLYRSVHVSLRRWGRWIWKTCENVSDELWFGDQDRLRIRFAAIKHARALCRAVLGQDASRSFTFHD